MLWYQLLGSTQQKKKNQIICNVKKR